MGYIENETNRYLDSIDENQDMLEKAGLDFSTKKEKLKWVLVNTVQGYSIDEMYSLAGYDSDGDDFPWDKSLNEIIDKALKEVGEELLDEIIQEEALEIIENINEF